MPKKLTTEEFIERVKKVHGDRYDYSKVEYINNYTKVKIICSAHGEFEQNPKKHLMGRGCSKCVGRNKTTKDFVLEAEKIHGNKYNYSLTKYTNLKTQIKIICKKHGEFKQRPSHHLRGHGCPKCTGRGLSYVEIIERFQKIHEKKYDYSKFQYINAKTKSIIICPKHGEFKQAYYSHLSGSGCPECCNSTGEILLKSIIKETITSVKQQHKFEKCKNIKQLPFDFYLNKFNCCLEFHGIQHFKPIKFFGGTQNFKKRQKRDRIKKDYCEKNNITLIVIFKVDYNSKNYSFITINGTIPIALKNVFKKHGFTELSNLEYENFKSKKLKEKNKY